MKRSALPALVIAAFSGCLALPGPALAQGPHEPAAAVQPGSYPQAAQQTLTNSDVIQMVQAHLGTEIIVKQIQNSRCRFSLTTRSLIALKRAGVPDKVIEAMQAKGNASAIAPPGGPGAPMSAPSAPPAPAASQNAASAPAAAAGAPFPDLRVLDADAYSRMAGDDPTILSLNFMRLVPHALDDEKALTDFTCLNNRGNRTLFNHLDSEFDRPATLAYYKANADKILSGAPDTIEQYADLRLGEYDATRQAFPVMSPTSPRNVGWFSGNAGGDMGLEGCGGSKSDWLTPGSPIAADYREGAVVLMAMFKPFYVSWLPMDPASARSYVDALAPGQRRSVRILFKVQILQQPPKILVTPNGRNQVQFAGEVREVTLLDEAHGQAGQGGRVLATISPYASADMEEQAAGFFYKGQYSSAFGPAQQACAAGNQDACGLQGMLVAFGLGVAADAAQGMALMRNSCNVGSSAGCDALATAYSRGGPVPQNQDIARQYFTTACDGGFADGCVYEALASVTPGYPLTPQAWDLLDRSCMIGIDQFTTACNGGYADACVDLGRCYERGVGVSQDNGKAKEIFQQACSLGDKPVCKQLGHWH